MNSRLLAIAAGTLFATTVANGAAYRPDTAKNLGFPIYTNAPAGKQLSGAHAPATSPALAPAESQQAIQLPPGFEARLFASEPEVVNPVAMTWDERGRLWVLELYEYPKGAPQGATPRDRIKILEDTNADGRADKVTVWADSLNLACGLLLGNGGAYVGAAPDLLFFQDTNGNGKADKRTVIKTGFGMHDRHEMLNGFTWGPDGYLYLTEGVFTHSQVKDPNDPNDTGVVMDAAVARFDPRTKKFEVFADGTSNPWGVDFDRYGNAFVSACVIPHFFHMAAGGLYKRQGGQPSYPYAYELLPEIASYQHYRAAHAGVDIYQGNQFPAEWQGLAFLGNIHQSAVNLNRLDPVGAGFKASKATNVLGSARGDFAVGGGNFLVSKDQWFRPVAQHTGPDGALWVMDWYDRYPCYQNAQADPEGVDREHGRIWRIVYVGNEPGKAVPSRPGVDMDLAKLSSAQLVELLAHPNSWQRRTAQRLLTERRDNTVQGKLQQLLAGGKTPEARLAAFWTLYTSGYLAGDVLRQASVDPEPAIRMWAARFIGEAHVNNEESFALLTDLARDKEPTVRSAVATAIRQYVSGSLTVNTPPPDPTALRKAGAVLVALVENSGHTDDKTLMHQIWMASEPLAARNPGPGLQWLAENGADLTPLSSQLIRKVMRRVCDQTNPPTREAQLSQVVTFLGAVTEKPGLADAALTGLLDGFKTHGSPPTADFSPILERLYASTDKNIADKARRLGVLWGDKTASLALIRSLNDSRQPTARRLEAIAAARESKSGDARAELLRLLQTETDAVLLAEGIRALDEFNDQTGDLGEAILVSWPRYGPGLRRSAADVLVTRRPWARALLSALETGKVSRDDVSAGAVRALVNSTEDLGLQSKRAAAIFGRVREANADKTKLIAAKKKIVLSGSPDLEKGRETARKACFVCHKLYGEGGEVGPDLTGVGCSTLDALLANIIDPNQLVGSGYENVEVETKDGRVLSGRMIENTDNRIRLLSAGPKEEVVAKTDIIVENGQPKIRISELSVMPEGLEQMSDDDFRNLVWFLLNPPEDKRPWTPQLRKEILGDEAPATKRAANVQLDRESVALWNPDWRVQCPPFEGAPTVLWKFDGRSNVLMTHPVDRNQPAVLTRLVEVPRSGRTTLKFDVASHEQGDWELRVVANDRVLRKETIKSDQDGRWTNITVDLTPFAGQPVALRLENAANDWAWEFGYWNAIEVKNEAQQASTK